MRFNDIHTVYFVGIGGIGMSALARFFNTMGKRVIGYDKTETRLTNKLVEEGVQVHYEDHGEQVLEGLDKTNTIVIYTPAIPKNHGEIQAFESAGFTIIKRAKALGIISEEQDTYAVAGTHGKTTTSSIMAHVLYTSEESCNAFIGGITTNYNSNCLIAEEADRVVVEADEFDRSFLQLSPKYSIVTSMDADHLDIYGASSALEDSFIEFAEKTSNSGLLMVQADLNFTKYTGKAQMMTYGFEHGEADWKGKNLIYKNGSTFFDITHGGQRFESVEFGLPGRHNAENALAVFGLLHELGVAEYHLREAFKSYKGVKRRFEFHIRRDDLVIIDDYAHHPSEISSFLNSVKTLYPGKKITVVFQPHLYSRTKDFMGEFAEALAIGDKLYLLDIYPAREQPIEGVTSQALLEKIKLTEKYLSSKANIVEDLEKDVHEVILIVGAGDIDTCVDPIVKHYNINDES